MTMWKLIFKLIELVILLISAIITMVAIMKLNEVVGLSFCFVTLVYAIFKLFESE